MSDIPNSDFEKLQEHCNGRHPGQRQYGGSLGGGITSNYEACAGQAVPSLSDDMGALQHHLQQRDYDDELRRARAVADEQYKYWCEGDVEEERKRRLPPWFIWAVNSTNFAILIVLILILLRLK